MKEWSVEKYKHTVVALFVLCIGSSETLIQNKDFEVNNFIMINF